MQIIIDKTPIPGSNIVDIVKYLTSSKPKKLLNLKGISEIIEILKSTNISPSLLGKCGVEKVFGLNKTEQNWMSCENFNLFKL